MIPKRIRGVEWNIYVCLSFKVSLQYRPGIYVVLVRRRQRLSNYLQTHYQKERDTSCQNLEFATKFRFGKLGCSLQHAYNMNFCHCLYWLLYIGQTVDPPTAATSTNTCANNLVSKKNVPFLRNTRKMIAARRILK